MFSASTTYEKQLRIEKTRLSHQVWSHGGSTFKKKRTLNGHFSRPAETDPYMETTHLKRGFPDVTLADVDVPLWEMNSNLFDFIADVGVDVNVYLLLFASLFST